MTPRDTSRPTSPPAADDAVYAPEPVLFVAEDDGGPPLCCRDERGEYSPCYEHAREAEESDEGAVMAACAGRVCGVRGVL